jgi:SAM-dependent methyltransferase
LFGDRVEQVLLRINILHPMLKDLLRAMRCPYCRGEFGDVLTVAGDSERVDYGLASCACFSFPIFHGVLLLRLAPDDATPEGVLQPFTSLQAAAIRYLARRDLGGLRAWTSEHAPLIHSLISGGYSTYVDAALAVHNSLGRHVHEALRGCAALGLLEGTPDQSPTDLRPEQIVSNPAGVPWYVARNFMPRNVVNRCELATVPLSGRLLSICCGHGYFELNVSGQPAHREIVSLDKQIVNLLILKSFVHTSANAVCYDAQLPLPFTDGFFDGCYGSAFLHELPSVAGVLQELLRVTSAGGWCIVSTVRLGGVPPIDMERHYQVCMNNVPDLQEYGRLFGSLAQGCEVRYFRHPSNWPEWDGPFAWKDLPQPGSDCVDSGSAHCSFLIRADGTIRAAAPLRLTMEDAPLVRLNPLYRIERQSERAYTARLSEAAPPGAYAERVAFTLPEEDGPDAWDVLFRKRLVVVVPASVPTEVCPRPALLAKLPSREAS